MADANTGGGAGAAPGSGGEQEQLLPAQTVVKIIGISARPELNEQFGTILTYNTERQRYMVSIATTNSTMLFKPENVTKATFIEEMQYKALEMKNAVMTLYNDPQTKEQLRRVYTSIDTRLPPKIKPEHVGGAIGVCILFFILIFGFVKTMLLCSVLVLLPTVSLPDIQANKSFQEIAQNFPNRWRENLSQMLGGRPVSDRMNYASLIIMALLVSNVLLTPYTSRRTSTPPPQPPQPYAAQSSAAFPESTEYNKPPTTATSIEQTLEQYYKLGYQDATDNKEYGTSLPPDPPATLSSSSSYSNTPDPPSSMDDIDYSYPPPPQPKKSKFNFSTIMAIITLARTGRELAQTPDGNYSMDLFVVNAKNMEPWKMGLMGICLYRLLTSLF